MSKKPQQSAQYRSLLARWRELEQAGQRGLTLQDMAEMARVAIELEALELRYEQAQQGALI